MTLRLSSGTLSALPPQVARPTYDRSRVRIGVVHLGIGAFHRAHQAVVFDDALNAGDLRWGVLGASLRSPDVRNQLAPQDGLYTLVIEDGATQSMRIIGAVQGVMVASEDPGGLVEAMASPDVHIVTLTVTEKGYYLDPASGTLKLEDPSVAADVADLSAPVTAPGFVTAALRLRRRRGLPPFTVISCDNLPHNGARIRSAVLEMAGRVDPELRDWIAAEGAFPQTMIDRIVPATTPEDIAALASELGVSDQGMVKTEPFTQWIIEDRFAGERPDFARFGVQLTEAVGPWEDAKLRLLNGAHSALAYLGALAGLEYVHEAVAVPSLKAFVERLWGEAETTLTPPPGLDIAAYRAELMARFSNTALRHRTRQIAMDGSQKLPQRLLATAQARLGAGQPILAIALGIAAWMRWQEGRTEAGAVVAVEDPLAAETARRLSAATDDAGKVAALLDLEAVFPRALSGDPTFRRAVTEAFLDLRRLGAVGAASAPVEIAA
ncbi:mannitol dehydrogenase family protein [Brevundimonas sp. Root1423]|uniref:mannitol dehydrogenase family protein n=1 Tax=Brevundimonas sp. Root1423 TaxID=1736462 RepID=UPI0006FE7304|nr:mannitol dehydrogenase family protein [Brevundimonas sp. Root1423]KQY75428.1 mannitol dehydrogenase [Brevundimonas sp. Root1423]